MKLFVILLITLVASISASPRKYNYVSTAEFEEISDRDMHPEPTENKYAKIVNAKANEAELTSEYWLEQAKTFVDQQLKTEPNTNRAKNIIFFLGDGMSHPTIAAARVYMGGEELKLSFENFPFTASSKTYCVDKQVADSACTATAYLSGVKANYETIGVSAQAFVGNCADNQDVAKRTESIASWAMAAGKEAGFVTTTRVTHASPSGVYAHITHRDWENDAEVVESNCDSTTTDDIAEQLVHGDVAKKLKVMMGGGSRNFVDSSVMTQHGGAGYRNDGKNLIDEWKNMNASRTYIATKQELLNVNPASVQQILGIFNDDHIEYNLDIQDSPTLQATMPSLTDMTLKAIDILSLSENGYFLFVEGGRIDHGHHKNQARYAIDETAQFSKAIEAALGKINLNETLVVVTADHGHVMSLAGYAPRGNDIFGFAGTGEDNVPYMTLSYANGLGYYDHTKATGGRVDATTLDMKKNDVKFPATVPLDLETHGGEDVGIWATGPWSHLFQGTLEQNVIPHIMAYAACIGDGMKMCDQQ